MSSSTVSILSQSIIYPPVSALFSDRTVCNIGARAEIQSLVGASLLAKGRQSRPAGFQKSLKAENKGSLWNPAGWL